jgi:hypothetical protein
LRQRPGWAERFCVFGRFAVESKNLSCTQTVDITAIKPVRPPNGTNIRRHVRVVLQRRSRTPPAAAATAILEDMDKPATALYRRQLTCIRGRIASIHSKLTSSIITSARKQTLDLDRLLAVANAASDVFVLPTRRNRISLSRPFIPMIRFENDRSLGAPDAGKAFLIVVFR